MSPDDVMAEMAVIDRDLTVMREALDDADDRNGARQLREAIRARLRRQDELERGTWE